MAREQKTEQMAEIARLIPKVYVKLMVVTAALMKESDVSPGQRADGRCRSLGAAKHRVPCLTYSNRTLRAPRPLQFQKRINPAMRTTGA